MGMEVGKRVLYVLLAVLSFHWAGGFKTLSYLGILYLIGPDKPWFAELARSMTVALMEASVIVAFVLLGVWWADTRLNRSAKAERLRKEVM